MLDIFNISGRPDCHGRASFFFTFSQIVLLLLIYDLLYALHLSCVKLQAEVALGVFSLTAACSASLRFRIEDCLFEAYCAISRIHQNTGLTIILRLSHNHADGLSLKVAR